MEECGGGLRRALEATSRTVVASRAAMRRRSWDSKRSGRFVMETDATGGCGERKGGRSGGVSRDERTEVRGRRERGEGGTREGRR